MDLADDVAYSVHDVEDGIVAGHIDLGRLSGDLPAVRETVRDWYLPGVDDHALDETLQRLRGVQGWPGAAYDGTRRSLAALKNVTSDLIGRFCGSVQQATFARREGPFRRYGADVVVPEQTRLEIGFLKGVAAHYVMRSEERLATMTRQRDLLEELVEGVAADPERWLDPAHLEDLAEAPGEGDRRRVVVDQVASLTDGSAVAWHARVAQGRSPLG